MSAERSLIDPAWVKLVTGSVIDVTDHSDAVRPPEEGTRVADLLFERFPVCQNSAHNNTRPERSKDFFFFLVSVTRPH